MLFLSTLVWIGLWCASCCVAQVSCPSDFVTQTIRSQADADALNACETFNGSIRVTVENQTDLISMDHIRYITGDLLLDDNSTEISNLTSFSMNSLVAITGDLQLYGRSIQAIDLPALSSVGNHTIISDMPLLSSLILSNLSSTAYLRISKLPSLQKLSFDTGLKQVTGLNDDNDAESKASFSITNTSLVSVTGLLFPDIESLTVQYNPNLESLTFSLDSMHCNGTGITGFLISDNPKLTLSFPYLKTIQKCDSTEIGQLSNFSVPDLTSIEGSFEFTASTPLVFEAPSLVSVSNMLVFNQGNITQINLPALKTVSEMITSDNPANHQSNGINVPSLTNCNNFVVEGTSQSPAECQALNNQRCQGLIGPGRYECNNEEVGIASDPNTCQYNYPASGWTLLKKLLVGLVFPLCLILLVCIVYYCWRVIKRRRAKQAGLEQSRELHSKEPLPKHQPHDDSDGVYTRSSIEHERNMATDARDLTTAVMVDRETSYSGVRPLAGYEQHRMAPGKTLPVTGNGVVVSPVSPLSPEDHHR